jgi:hypothetical protein
MKFLETSHIKRAFSVTSHMVGQRSCTQLKGVGFDTVLPHQDYQIPQTAVRSNDDDYDRNEKTHDTLSTTTHIILPWTEPESLQSKGSI